MCAWAPVAGQGVAAQQERAQSPKQSLILPLLFTELHLSVVDKNGNPVDALRPESFHVKEDGLEQKVIYLKHDDEPISIGIVIDRNGRMTDTVRSENEAAIRFLKASNPEDEFFLIDFNQHVELVTDTDTLNARLAERSAAGGTALLDAVYLGLTQMGRAHNRRKILVIVSDGKENKGRYKESEVVEFARQTDIQINGLEAFRLPGYGKTEEEQQWPDILGGLCRAGGGQMVRVTNPDGLSAAATKMAENLRAQYVIRYYPSNGKRDGRWRTLKVKVDVPTELYPAQVFTRNGYYGPIPVH
ncbi:MAG: VWA domain-containing protein [Candidatus Acidiferrales bacterium]